jgi:hypothetical protein
LTGFKNEPPNPWETTQQAAADTLKRREAGESTPQDWALKDDSPR